MHNKFLIIACGILLIGGVLAGVFLLACGDDWCFVTKWQKVRAAESFDRCASLGFPVTESYPRQCRASDKTFTETIVPLSSTTVLKGKQMNEKVRLSEPFSHALIKSPLSIRGEARGNWYFEASFPVRLLDANGKELAIVHAQAKDEWMTPEFVPYSAELTFNPPTTKTGTLILRKDNPSGLPEHDDSLTVPVRFALFQSSGGLMRNVDLYYYSAKNDLDASGNAQCTKNGLAPVERTIPSTKTPIQDTLRLFFVGLIEENERQSGISTDYPLSGFVFKSATLKDGIVTLEFSDPLNLTSGGACRAAVLWMQIEATVEQFPEVKGVRFVPPELFQP
ncbi:MAG: hypothetical protein A3D65_02145 [Candidatus Lloydbacteria bacterium RIFCSPHIGHO2_02_FULL_50_13]|uniref:Uncharacterized protein n=1 Tax=Candidatus Lloydbacteria bacterium RIFCSPHIGHO2_02_FULL_50_13 TaxID=1798661 RepID=A0A1G2D0W2_9BACT|nr:MAG: hypothetical protein A3D65_02145 [Candidatus Lloydbacteria bacterium RIFCSPHIGHO2_02_FULL_50_13]